MTADVVVAGAGPAGIAAAVGVARLRPDLAAAGRVVCFDKARFPREKPCGGGLTGHARSALETLGLTLRVPAVACGVGRIVYGREQQSVPLGRPVEVVRREDFDADLVAQARARGVVVIEGEGIADHRVDRARGVVTVTTSAGRAVEARVLVAADGAGSRIRKQLVGDEAAGRARPLRLFKLELPAPRPFPDEMIYDFSPMQQGLRGYVWLFPVSGGRLNVGAMHTPSRRLSSGEILDLLARTLARHGVVLPSFDRSSDRGSGRGSARGWPAWPYVPRAPIAGPHLLSVGDAAGIDALTGEGIAVGLEQGPIAGAEIRDALASGDFSFAGYARRVRRATVGRELALDRSLAACLYARRGFPFWMSLVMFDSQVCRLYAARVSGSEILADRTGDLFKALGRHALRAPWRMRRLAAAARA